MIRRSRGPACGDATRDHGAEPPTARQSMSTEGEEAAA
jgi:hypothetical protein